MADQPGLDAATGGRKLTGRERWSKRARRSSRSSGQIAVLFVLSMLAVIPAMGLIFDGGNIYVQRRTAQNAADAAALAATRALMRDFPAPSTHSDTANLIAASVCQYLTNNAFGSIPSGTSTAKFVGASGGLLALADQPHAQITLPTDPTHQLLDCSPATIAALPPLTIPDSAAGVHVDATIGPFYTFVSGFLGKGVAGGTGAGIAQATATAGATVQGAAVTSFAADNSPFIVCGINTTTAPVTHPDPLHPLVPGAFPILLPGGPPYRIDPNAYGKTFLIHAGFNVDTCGDTTSFTGLANQPQNLADNVANLDLGTTPATLTDLVGVNTNTTKNRVDGFGGCSNTAQDQCVMLIPIAISTPLPLGTNQKVCVAWGAFWITQHLTSHWGQLLSSYNVGVGPESFSWTFGTRGSIQIVSQGATS